MNLVHKAEYRIPNKIKKKWNFLQQRNRYKWIHFLHSNEVLNNVYWIFRKEKSNKYIAWKKWTNNQCNTNKWSEVNIHIMHIIFWDWMSKINHFISTISCTFTIVPCERRLTSCFISSVPCFEKFGSDLTSLISYVNFCPKKNQITIN